jgi:hypothetical protein
MPTYDYKCKQCGYKFEGKAGMNDPCPPCPVTRGSEFAMFDPPHTCGGETEKIFTSAAPAHFQGGGWAADNYASSKPKGLTVNQVLDRSSGK